jgi:hypothetical protein
MSTFMNNLKRAVAALGLIVGVTLSGSALADSAKFDGTWSVQLVAGAGLCGTLPVRSSRSGTATCARVAL